MAGTVVVFDFDKTIIDLDSDNWVVDELGATELFNQLLPTMPWNPLMDRMMKELHSQGRTIVDIAEVLKRVPMHPRIVPAIKAAHALGCDLRVVSDANLFFIETILTHLGVRDLFSEINTNPSFVDEEGRLRIFPYHDFRTSPHGCNLCPPNMCKGLVVERMKASTEGTNKFIYLGDGVGDFCPSLKLKDGDYMMPRKDFPVWELISKNRSQIKAEIHEWSDGEELERVLLQLINTILVEENNKTNAQLFSIDCKLRSIPMAAHESALQPLPVRP
ncbi:hypothetical protein RJ639_039912 [Escallonia herrerae]|uniref:Uncharacterized protein n=1 Tax=Escallonia herrerae TaxID=1293975 RepID=A0AA88UTR1_9ASTE|nr:hypothetical protein RJ639_025804 [Escallonia herrerae]KAK3028903.1 hypothetical protein RJ639_039912 [Escallonia herrerae]